MDLPSVHTEVRLVSEAELPTVAKINVDMWRSTYKGWFSDAVFQSLSYDKAEARFRKHIFNEPPSAFIYVATVNGNVVGYALSGPSREKVNGYVGELWGLYVQPAYHRMGLGRKLVAAVARHLLHLGFNSMLVVVFQKNSNARAFYESIGGEYLFAQNAEIAGEPAVDCIYGWSDLKPTFHGDEG